MGPQHWGVRKLLDVLDVVLLTNEASNLEARRRRQIIQNAEGAMAHFVDAHGGFPPDLTTQSSSSEEEFNLEAIDPEDIAHHLMNDDLAHVQLHGGGIPEDL